MQFWYLHHPALSNSLIKDSDQVRTKFTKIQKDSSRLTLVQFFPKSQTPDQEFDKYPKTESFVIPLPGSLLSLPNLPKCFMLLVCPVQVQNPHKRVGWLVGVGGHMGRDGALFYMLCVDFGVRTEQQ